MWISIRTGHSSSCLPDIQFCFHTHILQLSPPKVHTILRQMWVTQHFIINLSFVLSTSQLVYHTLNINPCTVIHKMLKVLTFVAFDLWGIQRLSMTRERHSTSMKIIRPYGRWSEIDSAVAGSHWHKPSRHGRRASYLVVLVSEQQTRDWLSCFRVSMVFLSSPSQGNPGARLHQYRFSQSLYTLSSHYIDTK